MSCTIEPVYHSEMGVTMESRKREKRHREGANGRWVCRSSSAWTCSAAKQIRATRACMRDNPATVTTGLDVPSGKKDFFNDPATVVTKELDVVLPSGKKRTHGTSTACHLLV